MVVVHVALGYPGRHRHVQHRLFPRRVDAHARKVAQHAVLRAAAQLVVDGVRHAGRYHIFFCKRFKFHGRRKENFGVGYHTSAGCWYHRFFGFGRESHNITLFIGRSLVLFLVCMGFTVAWKAKFPVTQEM